MPYNPAVYNHFDDIPVFPADEMHWEAIVDSCDPLVREVAFVRASAVSAGIKLSGSEAAQRIAASEPLINDKGTPSHALLMEVAVGSHPGPQHAQLSRAGLCMIAAASAATQLLGEHPSRVDDYTGQLGERFVQRTAVAAVRRPALRASIGRILNSHPARNLQSRIFRQAGRNGELQPAASLTLAASLAGPGADEWGMSSLLRVRYDSSRRKVGATLLSASRNGDFIVPETDPSFNKLFSYSEAVAKLRVNGRNS